MVFTSELRVQNIKIFREDILRFFNERLWKKLKKPESLIDICNRIEIGILGTFLV